MLSAWQTAWQAHESWSYHHRRADLRLIVELEWRNAYIIGYFQDNSNDSRDIQKGKTEQEARG